MATHVLVPLDGSPQATEALDHALAEHPEATITLLRVIDPVEAGYTTETLFPSSEWFEEAKEDTEALFGAAQERAGDRALETVVEVGRPSRAIVAYAEEHGIDHIVVGSHGREGVARVLLGSVAESVVRRSPVPVTVVR